MDGQEFAKKNFDTKKKSKHFLRIFTFVLFYADSRIDFKAGFTFPQNSAD